MHLDGTVVMHFQWGVAPPAQPVSASTGVIEASREPKKGLSDYLNEQLKYFVGLDWGSENHRIMLLNQEGRVLSNMMRRTSAGVGDSGGSAPQSVPLHRSPNKAGNVDW
jgi:hypothetical protein